MELQLPRYISRAMREVRQLLKSVAGSPKRLNLPQHSAWEEDLAPRARSLPRANHKLRILLNICRRVHKLTGRPFHHQRKTQTSVHREGSHRTSSASIYDPRSHFKASTPMASKPKAALAVIDVQEDFCEPNGSLAVKDGRALAPIWNKLLDLPFEVKLATRDYHPADHISFASQHTGKQPFTSQHTIPNPENKDDTAFTTLLWPDHCIIDTPGCELIPELEKEKFDFIIKKGQDKRVESYSAFGPVYRNPKVGMSGLGDTLKNHGITDLYVVGLAYDYCVKHTAIDAVEHGFKTFVLEDATKAVDQSDEGIAATRKELKDGGVSIIDMNSEELKAVSG